MALTGLTKVTNIGINTTTIPTLGGSRNTGVVTATNFIGDGSGLTGVTGSGAGVIVRDGGSLVGTAGTINFGTNLNVSAISAGIVTVTNAASATALTNLSDVTISSASNGQILKHNGSVFVNTAETTYSQSSVASGSNVNLRLTDSGGTNDDILITAGSNITFSSVTANGFTIAASGGGGGGGLSNVVEDTSPELGGNLNLNNKFITGSGGVNVSGVTTSTSFVGNITGNVTGNADTATTATNVTVSANNSTDETVYPIFVDGATGAQGAESDTGLSYNPSSGNLTATKFTGSGVALTGVVTSIVAGSNITLTGGPTGIVTIASSGGGVSLSGSTNNTVATVTGANALIGEANLTFDGSTLGIAAGSSDNKIQIDGSAPYIQFREGTTNKAYIQWSPSGYLQLANEEDGEVLRLDDGESGLIWRVGTNNRTVWTSGNDGASSGLNADLLDGQEGSYYRDADNINAGTLAAARVATLNQDTTGNAGTATTATNATNVTVTDESSDTNTFLVFTNGATGNQTPHTGTNLTFNSSSGALTAGSFVKSGGSSSQFLKADGSIDSNTYLTSGSYLENVSEDSSPQLGGNLDLNSNNITGTGDVNIVGLITATSAVTTWTVGNSGTDHYTFTGNGFTSATNDPDLYLVRGQRYSFIITSGSSHPFYIKTVAGTGTGNQYTTGVTNNGATSGSIHFNVPFDAPAHLYYQCSAHGNMVGNIYIVGQHLANGANNRVLTATSAYGMNGESGLTFDGTTLKAEAGNPILELSGTTSNGGNTFMHINANANHWCVGADNYTQQNMFVIKSGTPASSSHRLAIDSYGVLRVGNTHSQGTSGNTKRIALGAKASIWGWTTGNINGALTLADNYYWDGSNNKAIESDYCAYLSLRSGSMRFGCTAASQTGGQNVSGGIHEKVRFENDGNVSIADGNLSFANGHGIDFSATASNGSGELFNDFEYGSWTPTISAHLGGGSFTQSGAGRYVKVGNLVSLWGYLSWTAKGGSGVVNLNATGLPFSTHNTSANNVAVTIGSRSGWNNQILVGQMYQTGYINVQYINSSGNSVNVNQSALDNSGNIYYSFQYEASSI